MRSPGQSLTPLTLGALVWLATLCAPVRSYGQEAFMVPAPSPAASPATPTDQGAPPGAPTPEPADATDSKAVPPSPSVTVSPPVPQLPAVAPQSDDVLVLDLAQQSAAAAPALPAPVGGPVDSAEIEAFLAPIMATEMERGRVPGAVFVLVRDGKILYAGGYGVADRETGTPMDADGTIVRVASISKLFTATAVMQLVEQGKLALEADVNTYLRDFQVPATYPEPVIVANLLTHTGGFDDHFFGTATRRAADVLPLGDYLARRMPPRVMPPNTLYSYSNDSFALAGYLVETVTGTDFSAYVDAHILQPLGMTSSGFRLREDMAPRLASGYMYWHGAYQKAPYEYEHSYPAGAMHTTATDLARFMIAHLQNGRYGDARILGDGTARIMHRQYFTHHPDLSGTALGFYEHHENGLRAIQHDGLLRGYASELLLFPKQNVGWFVSATHGSIASDTSAFARHISEKLLDHYYPAESAPRPQPPADFASRAHRFTGSYIPNRRSRTTIQKLATLMGQSRITAEPDGSLVLHQPNQEPRKWVEVGPLRFDEVGTDDRAVFRADGGGTIRHFIIGTQVLDKIPWYVSTRWQFRLLGGVVVLFASAVLLWAPGAVLRRIRPSLASAARGGAARALSGWAGIVILIALGGIATVLQGNTYDLVFGIPVSLKVLLLVGNIGALLAALTIPVCLGAWVRRTWNLIGRVQYTLVALAAVGYLWFACYWNLLGLKY